MKLFKRILMSLFPEDVVNQPINPISMFISFVSAKQFFSVVNRKIVENYKLNLFDINLDSFDVKLGFGKSLNIKQKEIEQYYSYGVVANFNGYRFYSASNVGSLITLVCSIYLKDPFSKHDPKYFVNFLLTVYYLHFVFLSRIKVFPYKNDKDNYNRFIEVFFQFYKLVCDSKKFTYSVKEFNQIKIKLLENIQIFFMLFYVYKKYNNIFVLSEGERNDLGQDGEYDFYEWLLDDDIKKGSFKNLGLDFLSNYKKYTKSYSFSATEKKLMKVILPADVLIRHILNEDDIFQTVDFVIKGIYNNERLDELISSFLKNDEKLEEFLEFIFNYQEFQDNYFTGVKKFINWKYRLDNEYDAKIEQELDELMSTVGKEKEIDEMKIPDKLKRESQTTEKLINFYLTFLGGFWVSRGDNMYLRLFKRELFDFFELEKDSSIFKQDSLVFYGSLIYTYSKNAFYYKFAFDNVKAGKEKFHLPFKSSLKQVNSNKFLVHLLNQVFVADTMQDINTKDIKLYIQNKDIIKHFKTHFYDEISSCVKGTSEKLIKNVYGTMFQFMDTNFKANEFTKLLSDKELSNLKDSVYTFDLWIYLSLIKALKNEGLDLTIRYSNASIMGILSFLRNSLLGFCLYIKFLENQENSTNKKLHIDVLKKIYIMEILFLSQDYYYVFEKAINDTLQKYDTLLNKWINIDDNKTYLSLGYTNWVQFISEKHGQSTMSSIMGEDIIWFRGYLKNIVYYNKKFLIPKE